MYAQPKDRDPVLFIIVVLVLGFIACIVLGGCNARPLDRKPKAEPAVVVVPPIAQHANEARNIGEYAQNSVSITKKAHEAVDVDPVIAKQLIVPWWIAGRP